MYLHLEAGNNNVTLVSPPISLNRRVCLVASYDIQQYVPIKDKLDEWRYKFRLCLSAKYSNGRESHACKQYHYDTNELSFVMLPGKARMSVNVTVDEYYGNRQDSYLKLNSLSIASNVDCAGK